MSFIDYLIENYIWLVVVIVIIIVTIIGFIADRKNSKKVKKQKELDRELVEEPINNNTLDTSTSNLNDITNLDIPSANVNDSVPNMSMSNNMANDNMTSVNMPNMIDNINAQGISNKVPLGNQEQVVSPNIVDISEPVLTPINNVPYVNEKIPTDIREVNNNSNSIDDEIPFVRIEEPPVSASNNNYQVNDNNLSKQIDTPNIVNIPADEPVNNINYSEPASSSNVSPEIPYVKIEDYNHSVEDTKKEEIPNNNFSYEHPNNNGAPVYENEWDNVKIIDSPNVKTVDNIESEDDDMWKL